MAMRADEPRIREGDFHEITKNLMSAKTSAACRLQLRDRAMMYLSYAMAGRGDEIRSILLCNIGMRSFDKLGAKV